MHKATHLKCALLGGVLWTSSALSQAPDAVSEAPERPPVRSIPGITADDRFPNACVDCHINYVEMNMDTRLSALMTRWSEAVEPAILEIAQAVAGPDIPLTGVHPPVDTATNDIPTVCLGCHERGANGVVPLAPLLHKIHVTPANGEVFLSVFQGECTHCHKLDQATGRWQIPRGREE